MPIAESHLQLLKQCCQTIVERGQGVFRWQWDPYFGAVLSIIPSESQDEVSGLLTECCGSEVDVQSLTNEPDDLRSILNRVGGLRPGQKVYLTDFSQPAFVLVAWWPWGNGSSISIRIRLMANGIPVPEEDESLDTFKSWFGI